jgi:hypothetical protein
VEDTWPGYESSSIGLKPDVTIDQAKSEMTAIQNSLNQLYPSTNRGLGADVMPLKQVIVWNADETLLVGFFEPIHGLGLIGDALQGRSSSPATRDSAPIRYDLNVWLAATSSSIRNRETF